MLINNINYPEILSLMSSSFFEIRSMDGRVPEELIRCHNDGELTIDGDVFPQGYHPNFVCSNCHRFLFNESEIKWNDYNYSDGYYPLREIKNYNLTTGTLGCEFCKREIKLRIFSYYA